MFAYCDNKPVNYIDYSGCFPKFTPDFLDKSSELVETAYGLLRYVTEYNSKGKLYEYWVDDNNKVLRSRHHTNHGNSKKHPLIPHDHRWYDDDDGNNKPDSTILPPDEGYKSPTTKKNNDFLKKAVNATATVATGYIIYTGIKWVIALVAAPPTGGASLAVAGVTP